MSLQGGSYFPPPWNLAFKGMAGSAATQVMLVHVAGISAMRWFKAWAVSVGVDGTGYVRKLLALSLILKYNSQTLNFLMHQP